jgi:hypothetical protein
MLSNLIDPDHLNRFRLALYNLEGFDIQGRKWTIDQRNRVESATGIEDLWDDLGFIDDWYLQRVVPKKGKWSPSLSTTSRSVYSKRRKPLKSFYIIDHRVKQRSRSRFGSKLPKRRKLTTVGPWNGYIVSYLSERRKSRLLTGIMYRYQPTNEDIVSILLVSAPFIQSKQRQLEETLELNSSIRLYKSKRL